MISICFMNMRKPAESRSRSSPSITPFSASTSSSAIVIPKAKSFSTIIPSRSVAT